LLECDAKRLRHRAGDGVGGAAGSEGCDYGNRLARILIGAQRRADQHGAYGQRRSQGNAMQFHAWSLPAVASYDVLLFGRVGLADTRALTCGDSIADFAALARFR